jgi:hypothetical protein
MEPNPLAQARAESVQAAKADLPSLSSWRCQDSPKTPEIIDEILVSEVHGSSSGNTGESG